MKNKLLTVILVSVISLSILNIFHVTPQVYANPGAPYTIVKNPYLNDTNYWLPQLGEDPLSESYSIVNSSGTYLHLAQTAHSWYSWHQPWAAAWSYQGLLMHGGSNYDIGKGLNNYIYIPKDIEDGKIIVNVTVERLQAPETIIQAPPPISFEPLLAPGALTHFGVGFWYAMKVRFWDDPSVPEHLRGKETYLGWMSPDTWDCPNMFVQEFFLDTRYDYACNGNTWSVVSEQDGNITEIFAWPGFLGSSQDWDWHSNLDLNHTDLNTPTTFTIDLGKRIKEFVNFFEHRFDPDKWFLFGFLRAAQGYGGILPNLGQPDHHPQPYDLVGFTLFAVAPTMEVVDARIGAHFTWFQIYDYRDNGGQPVTDPLFWDCNEMWTWLNSKGMADPFQEHWMNAILPSELTPFMHSVVGKRFTPTAVTPVTDGASGGVGEVWGYDAENFNLTAAGPWGKAGILELFAEGGSIDFPDQACDIRVNILAVTDYWFYGGMYSNAGFYFDYEWGKGDVTLQSGEIICYDYPNSSEEVVWHPVFTSVEINLTKSAGTGYWFKLFPHIEEWWTDFELHGFIEVGFEWTTDEEIVCNVNLSVNNSNWGSVSPSPGTYTYQAGTNIALSATANSGYYFDHWNVRNDLKGVNVNYAMNPLNLTVDIDYNVTAYFASSSPPPPATYTLQLSTFIYPLSGIRLETLVPPTLLHNESSNWISGTGTWSYAIGSIINLGITNDQGWYFYYWFDGTNHVTQKNWTTTLNSDKSWRAIFLPPYQTITVKDANSGVELSGFTVYYGSSSWYVDGSGCYIVGNYKTYSLTITKSGYYDTIVDVKLEQGSTVIYLTPIIYGGGGTSNLPCPRLIIGGTDLGFIDIHAKEDVVKNIGVSGELLKSAYDGKYVVIKLIEGSEDYSVSESYIDYVSLNGVPPYKALLNGKDVTEIVSKSDDHKIFMKLLDELVLYFDVPVKDSVFTIEGVNMFKMCKLFSYTFTILNATENVYTTWDNLLEVYPFYGTEARLTLNIHYNTTYPVIEVYAENIGMVKFNWTDIYHKLGCVYFDRVPVLTKFYGLRVESNSSLILDFELPAKPGELWKLLPGQDLPGTMLTDWKWRDGRVLLAFEPGDPTVSILLQTAMQQTQDVVFQFIMIIVMLVMMFATLKFIRDKF
jgi:hypothetical protein